MIRILFTDFDNTYMLHDYSAEIDSWIPEENIRMTEEYEKTGGKIVVTTGRGSPTVIDDLNRYGIIFDLIGANGSSIRRYGFPAEVSYINDETASTMFDNLMKVNYRIRYSHYVDDEVQYIFDNISGSIFPDSPEFNQYRISIQNTFNRTNKCSIRTSSPEEIEPIVRMLKNQYGDSITVSVPNDHELDITARGVDKGTAIDRLLEIYGLSKDEAAGIGDGNNDLAIMEKVSLRFAMKGADPDLISSCNMVVESVADALQIIMNINEQN